MKIIIYGIICSLCIYTHITPHNKMVNAKTKIIELSSGYIVARAIHTAAQLKLADHMVNGSQHIATLAKDTGTHSGTLYRLLRLLTSYGIFQETENQCFSLTPLAEPLLSSSPESLWAWITHHHDPTRWTAYADMEYSIITGNPSFNHIFGKGYFDFISESTILSKNFDEGMKNLSTDEDMHIAQSYDFSPYPTIADIGGGTGGLLTEIIKTYTKTKGLLFDLPHVQPTAQTSLEKHGMKDDITFVTATEFFNPIPKNANLYILKRILHDWNDEDCVTILTNCCNAMSNDTRLLIIEAIIAEQNVRDFGKDVDLEMMVLFGGQERTKQEWISLLDKAHLKINHIYSTPSMLSIIEVQKK